MAKWSITLMLQLISLYKQFPILYDAKCEGFLDNEKRNCALSDITASLKILRPEVTQAEVRFIINKLRKQYLRERNALIKLKEGRPEGGGIYVPKLRFFNHLKFLDLCCDSMNLAQSNDENYTETPDASSTDFSDTNVQRNISIKTLQVNLNRQIARALSLVEEMETDMRPRTKQKESPQYILGKMVETELKGIPEDLFFDAKWKIMDIIRDTQKVHLRSKMATCE